MCNIVENRAKRAERTMRMDDSLARKFKHPQTYIETANAEREKKNAKKNFNEHKR